MPLKMKLIVAIKILRYTIETSKKAKTMAVVEWCEKTLVQYSASRRKKKEEEKLL